MQTPVDHRQQTWMLPPAEFAGARADCQFRIYAFTPQSL